MSKPDDKMTEEELDEALQSLIDEGLVVVVGYDDKGEELYMLATDAIEKGITPVASRRKTPLH